MRTSASTTDLAAIAAVVNDHSTCPPGSHSDLHARRVAETGLALADVTPAVDRRIVALFALFHDAMRINDAVDGHHGRRAARFVRRLRRSLPLTPAQLERLVWACSEHTAGVVTDDATVGVCWDADRLNLVRYDRVPRRSLLSNAAALDFVAWVRDLQQREPLGWDEIASLL